MNANTMTPPSLGRVYIALPWSPKFVKQCIVDLSMSELSGFADARNRASEGCNKGRGVDDEGKGHNDAFGP